MTVQPVADPTVEARKSYDAAVERHFADADQLLREGKPDEAEAVAKAAADLRLEAYFELRDQDE